MTEERVNHPAGPALPRGTGWILPAIMWTVFLLLVVFRGDQSAVWYAGHLCFLIGFTLLFPAVARGARPHPVLGASAFVLLCTCVALSFTLLKSPYLAGATGFFLVLLIALVVIGRVARHRNSP